MGTNYYLHLGKRSAAGEGKTRFTCAVDLPGPEQVVGQVHDEYGREMTYAEFEALIENDEKDFDSLGQRFS